MKKRMISAVLTLAVVISVFAAYAPQAKAFTQFGPYDLGNITWTVVVDTGGATGTLTISRRAGVTTNVAMQNYSAGSRPPWYVHSAQVTRIVIDDSITGLGTWSTGIGSWAFADFTRVTSVVIPADVTISSIGADAFRGCAALRGFYLNDGFTPPVQRDFTAALTIGDNAFNSCGSLDRKSVV